MNFPEKISLIKIVQKHLGLDVDGDDGRDTWNGIVKALGIIKEQPTSQLPLSQDSINLIIKYEVGGGEKYYSRYLQKPTWPQGASGVTIGIGYDLGYNSMSQFRKDWGDKLTDSQFERLSKHLGVTGSAAKSRAREVSDIIIPWNSALEVFLSNTIPRFIQETLKAFPEADKLAPNAFGALVSLVFNRGSSLVGERRKEMANIRPLVLKKDYDGIADQIIKMKRIWVGKGLDGLLARRDEEAALVRSKK
jgi:hypothetical protein